MPDRTRTQHEGAIMAHNDIDEARSTYDGMIRISKVSAVIIALVVALVLILIN